MVRKESSEKIFGHYRKSADGCYIIDLMVPTLDKLYNSYDPSPLHQREIDPAVMKMILSQVVVFPLSSDFELHLHMPRSMKRKRFEWQIEHALRNHFEYELLESELHLKRRIQKGLKTFRYSGSIFISFFVTSYLLGSFDNVFVNMLSEGMAVGSWVSLWHPIQTLLYSWLPLYEDKKKFSKLLDVKIRFNYV
jgi:hypothetical protein